MVNGIAVPGSQRHFISIRSPASHPRRNKISRSTRLSFLSRGGMVFGAATRALSPGQLLRRSAYRTLSREPALASKKL